MPQFHGGRPGDDDDGALPVPVREAATVLDRASRTQIILFRIIRTDIVPVFGF